MRLSGVHIRSFGKLRGLEMELGPGMNLIQAPNESGKSTLLAFIAATLYGFVRPDARTRTLDESYERYMPWSGQDYGGRIDYCLSNGERYEVVRDFAGHSVRVFNSAGTDVTSAFEADRARERLFAQMHLGLDKGSFLSTIYIDHASSGVLKNPSGIVQKLQSFAAMGSEAETTSSRKAIELLEAAKSTIGERETATTKRYGMAVNKVKTLTDELSDARNRYGSISTDMERIQTICEELSVLQERLGAAQSVAKRVQLGELSEVVGLLDRIDGERSALLAELSKSPVSDAIRAGFNSLEDRFGAPLESVAQSIRRESDNEELAAAREIVRRDQEESGRLSSAASTYKALGGVMSLLALVSAVAGAFVASWVYALAAVLVGLALVFFWSASVRGRKVREMSSAVESQKSKMAERESRAAEAEGKIRNIFSTLGVEGWEPFERICAQCRDADQMDDRLMDLEERRVSLLTGRSEREMRETLALLQAEMRVLDAGTPGNVEQYQVEDISALQEEISRRERETIQLEAEASGALMGYRNIGDIEADLEAAKSELDDVLECREALDMAIEMISEHSRDVHDHYASELSRALNETAYKITSTYNEVRFDEDLGMNVRIPELGEWKPVDQLSWGTKEQFYVLLKLALAGMLSKSGEPLPILLDDVFAHTDDARLPILAEFLLNLSKDHQVILFTCRSSQVEAFRRVAGLAGASVGSFTVWRTA